MTVNMPHPKTMPNGSILLLGISYPGLAEDGGRDKPKVFTYTLMKAGGVWYTSGSGKTPQAAGWTTSLCAMHEQCVVGARCWLNEGRAATEIQP